MAKVVKGGEVFLFTINSRGILRMWSPEVWLLRSVTCLNVDTFHAYSSSVFYMRSARRVT